MLCNSEMRKRKLAVCCKLSFASLLLSVTRHLQKLTKITALVLLNVFLQSQIFIFRSPLAAHTNVFWATVDFQLVHFCMYFSLLKPVRSFCGTEEEGEAVLPEHRQLKISLCATGAVEKEKSLPTCLYFLKRKETRNLWDRSEQSPPLYLQLFHWCVGFLCTNMQELSGKKL